MTIFQDLLWGSFINEWSSYKRANDSMTPWSGSWPTRLQVSPKVKLTANQTHPVLVHYPNPTARHGQSTILNYIFYGTMLSCGTRPLLLQTSCQHQTNFIISGQEVHQRDRVGDDEQTARGALQHWRWHLQWAPQENRNQEATANTKISRWSSGNISIFESMLCIISNLSWFLETQAMLQRD